MTLKIFTVLLKINFNKIIAILIKLYDFDYQSIIKTSNYTQSVQKGSRIYPEFTQYNNTF